MVPSCLPLAQYWQLSRRWPSSSGTEICDAGLPRAANRSFSVVPIWTPATCSRVGSLTGSGAATDTTGAAETGRGAECRRGVGRGASSAVATGASEEPNPGLKVPGPAVRFVSAALTCSPAWPEVMVVFVTLDLFPVFEAVAVA